MSGSNQRFIKPSNGKRGHKSSDYEEDHLPLVSAEENLHALVIGDEDQPTPIQSMPMMASFNDSIRPILDAVDQLRNLMVMKEGIQLPTIVVVGDQSSGKSSVLESLAGISLPRGQGICTRVPLIMRLQHNTSLIPEIFLEFNGKTIQTDEANVADAINTATEEIAGGGKGISDAPLTLVVKKNGLPDLTMVDLPGITRVPVHGQPDNIYEQIAAIVMQYIQPEESIILNVLPASVDFTTCESIRMSRQVDKTGQRTLAVVTKADKAPEGLLEKVTADDVNIGLGYVCVRNRIGDESYENARMEEANLFATHPLLSRIDKSIVGIPVLAKKLMHIQATIMAKCWPEIVGKINEKLNGNVEELNRMPKAMSSVAEFLTAFMQVIGSAKDSLRKTLVRGEYDEYPDDRNMHCVARVAEMFNQYSADLLNCPEGDHTRNFLMDEIRILEEAKAIELPNFLPRLAFLSLLQRKVEGVSHLLFGFVEKVWAYFDNVVLSVFDAPH
ncbi:DYNAMIN-RELATED PROTEIN [Salix viminalis]|uniref:DYNAMIN-RELATED PROTEIN n=1 Tax=Salix viminalis TaxID=40686 RepID=A0A9Q0YYA5_SALVM|nr:DYNAMIN-RELATED PROTEIN [Salix viminalis]